jgi:alkanesulfonate monooxygenase SsuD/methylene tetrahydromethanopterin reductase-like flavin-dependent oxidoreductase (luciferase family)
LEATGAYGDGWVTVGRDGKEVAQRMEHIKTGAKAVGRQIGPDFHTSVLTAGCVLRPGEQLTSERVINETGS